jgi:hypothetical protein
MHHRILSSRFFPLLLDLFETAHVAQACEALHGGLHTWNFEANLLLCRPHLLHHLENGETDGKSSSQARQRHGQYCTNLNSLSSSETTLWISGICFIPNYRNLGLPAITISRHSSCSGTMSVSTAQKIFSESSKILSLRNILDSIIFCKLAVTPNESHFYSEI